jgi:hypothetical protein
MLRQHLLGMQTTVHITGPPILTAQGLQVGTQYLVMRTPSRVCLHRMRPFVLSTGAVTLTRSTSLCRLSSTARAPCSLLASDLSG